VLNVFGDNGHDHLIVAGRGVSLLSLSFSIHLSYIIILPLFLLSLSLSPKGSGHVNGPYTISPLTGIKNYLSTDRQSINYFPTPRDDTNYQKAIAAAKLGINKFIHKNIYNIIYIYI
jgi:hypothetical protein